jgi:hypothetical protein
MHTVAQCRDHAWRCRELAKLVRNLEDKYALDHAAQSWERLAKLCEREPLHQKDDNQRKSIKVRSEGVRLS